MTGSRSRALACAVALATFAGCSLADRFDDLRALDAGVDGEIPEQRSSLAPPAVEGEPSAGHPRLAFRFTLPDGATAARVRIDGGAFEAVSPSATLYVTPFDLPEGDHTFEVEAMDAGGLWTFPGTFVTRIEYFERDGFWNGVARDIATTPHDHACAISAHNCYATNQGSPEANLDATVARILSARGGEADLVELDVKDEGGLIEVGHDDGVSGGPLLADVLDDPALSTGDEIPFLEIKESAPSEALARALLDILEARRDRFARNGRPVVLRAFHVRRQILQHVEEALEDDAYVFIRPYVRTSVLFDQNQVSEVGAFHDLILAASAGGAEMVEFHYRNRQLHTLLTYARSLGLGVNLWTVPVTLGEVYVAGLRESTDVITTDYPVASARGVVEDDTSVVYLDASTTEDPLATTISYFDGANQHLMATLSNAGRPSLVVGGPDEPLFGPFLRFERASSEFLPLADADARAGEGFLVSLVVRFRDVALADGETKTVLASSSLGGFTLEIHDPGTNPSVLRFGVYVGGAYAYATYPLASVPTDRSMMLTGAYDGNGGVYLWIDNATTGTTSGTASGGIGASPVPITLGADPQSGGTARYFSDVDVQMAMVQHWGAH